MSDFQTWAQSIDPKVWSKNDLHYSKLAWDEGRKELDAKLSDQRKNRIATIDVVQESYELKERIDELEAEVRRLQFSDHAINIILDDSDTQSPVFVEIENDGGMSISIGSRGITDDGLTKIRIDVADIINNPLI